MKIECTVDELKELLKEKSVDIKTSTDFANESTKSYSGKLPKVTPMI